MAITRRTFGIGASGVLLGSVASPFIRTAAAADTIKIGVVNSMSGGLAAYAQEGQPAAEAGHRIGVPAAGGAPLRRQCCAHPPAARRQQRDEHIGLVGQQAQQVEARPARIAGQVAGHPRRVFRHPRRVGGQDHLGHDIQPRRVQPRRPEHRQAQRHRQAFQPLFERYGVQLVLSGHDHDYQRSEEIHGVTYVVSGAASGSRRTGDEWFTARSFSWHHFVELAVFPQDLVVRAINQDRRVADEAIIAP